MITSSSSHVGTRTLSATPFTALFHNLQAPDVYRMAASIQELFTPPIQRDEEQKADG